MISRFICSFLILGIGLTFTAQAENPTPQPATAAAKPSVIVAVGAPGDSAYFETFPRWTSHWKIAAEASGNTRFTPIAGEDSHVALKKAIDAESKEGREPLWIVLLGHGTFDGKDPKFNLTGDDLTPDELSKWLTGIQRPIVLICAFSASGAWLKPISAPNRVVVTATKSGSENNFARFGDYFSSAIADPVADLDHDGQTSVLEAWLAATKKVAAFYEQEGRLATEHSLLDDNGDGLGTPPDWFRGLYAIKKPSGKALADGLRAQQINLIPSQAERELPIEVRARRDALESELATLREQKAALSEDEYLTKLEPILVQLAKLYRDKAVSKSEPATPNSAN